MRTLFLSWLKQLQQQSRKAGIGGIQQLLALVTAVALTVVVTLYRDQLLRLASYGYMGIFVACIAANSTVFVPAPSSAIVFTFGAVYHPLWVGIVGGLGATTGELIGYLAGISGRRVVENSEYGRRLKTWVTRYGMFAILIFAFLPLPLFDLVGVTAGALRISLVRFLIPTALGKILKMLIYAYTGAGILPTLEPFFKKIFGSQ